MIKYKSFGKVNLSLEILSKRSDGYHNIDSIMGRISLHDKISYKPIPGSDLIIESTNPDLPTDDTNLIYKAWSILKKYYDKDPGMYVHVEKNLPIASGLGGGTSNGVLTMEVLNQLWDLNLSQDQLIDLGKSLGADSTFFFYNELVRAEGIGDIVTPLGPAPTMYMILINNGKQLSSQQVYQGIEEYSSGIVSSIVDHLPDTQYLLDNGYNGMEKVSFEIYPELKTIKEDIVNTQASLSLMSGAGPTVMGIYKSRDARDMAYERLKEKYPTIWKTELR